MAAADSSAATNYIPILVAILPAILSPIVSWVLGRSKVSKEAATIDYLNKRLDMLRFALGERQQSALTRVSMLIAMPSMKRKLKSAMLPTRSWADSRSLT